MSWRGNHRLTLRATGVSDPREALLSRHEGNDRASALKPRRRSGGVCRSERKCDLAQEISGPKRAKKKAKGGGPSAVLSPWRKRTRW